MPTSRVVATLVATLLVVSACSSSSSGSSSTSTPSPTSSTLSPTSASPTSASSSGSTVTSPPSSGATLTGSTVTGKTSTGTPTACATGSTESSGLCVGTGKGADQVAAAIRASFSSEKLAAVVVGVWEDGKPVVVGALGNSMNGVPATPDMHHRLGNITAPMLTTVLMQLVDKGVLKLDDKLSQWFPDLPSADQVTLDMLAHCISGYAHFPATSAFLKLYDSDPFRTWTPAELVGFAMAEPLAFKPGTGFKFSDTNMVLLQMVMEKATGRPFGDLLTEGVLRPLGMKDTTLATSPAMLEPVLHVNDGERGVWEDATFWDPGWAQYAGGLGSNQDDVRTFIEALAAGTLLKPDSHRAQLAPTIAGIGPMTDKAYYAMGFIMTDGWLFANPSLQGYSAGIGHLPSKKITVVIYTTQTRGHTTNATPATDLFLKIAGLLSPDDVPTFPGR